MSQQGSGVSGVITNKRRPIVSDRPKGISLGPQQSSGRLLSWLFNDWMSCFYTFHSHPIVRQCIQSMTTTMGLSVPLGTRGNILSVVDRLCFKRCPAGMHIRPESGFWSEGKAGVQKRYLIIVRQQSRKLKYRPWSMDLLQFPS
jgi:hypothetical protein